VTNSSKLYVTPRLRHYLDGSVSFPLAAKKVSLPGLQVLFVAGMLVLGIPAADGGIPLASHLEPFEVSVGVRARVILPGKVRPKLLP
jgi:hypothetical protein